MVPIAFTSTSASDIKGRTGASSGPSEVVTQERLHFDAGQPEIPVSSTSSSEVVHEKDTIHRLMRNPTLLDPTRAPRYPIVLCHGV